MTSRPHELDSMAEALRTEIDGDAVDLARDLFGQSQPDTTDVPDHEMLGTLERAYRSQDRTTLLKYAKQDPLNFARLSRKLGVVVPSASPVTGP